MQTDGGDRRVRVEECTTMGEPEFAAEFDDQDYDNEAHDEYQGADPEVVKTILKGKDREMYAMEGFDIFDAVESLPEEACARSPRWENVSRRPEAWRCIFVAREFKGEDPELEGLLITGATSSARRLIDQHAVQHGYTTMVLRPERLLPCGGGRGGLRGSASRVGQYIQYRRPWWKMKNQLYGKRKASRKFNQYVVDKTSELGIGQCPRAAEHLQEARFSIVVR
eukprot:3171404-Pyramimonas_sp.AAC.2